MHAARLQLFRQTLDADLPLDYLEFLNKDGRTFFLNDNHVSTDLVSPDLHIGLSCLFGLQNEEPNLFSENKTYGARIPPGLIVIGDSNGGGDMICLDIAGKQAGSVYFWDHDREMAEDGSFNEDYSNTTLLASSFRQFLECINLDLELPGGSDVVDASLRF
jgi:hypothetical protein